ncbi:hypothetical protein D3C81_2028040 [compost metagenome]
MIGLCFFVWVRSVKGGDHTVQFKTHSRAVAFDGPGARRTEKGFDSSPFQCVRYRLGEYGFERTELFIVHGIIS